MPKSWVMTSQSSWSSFVTSRRAVAAGFLAALVLLLTGLAPAPPPEVAAAEFLLTLIMLGCVAVMAYHDDPAPVREQHTFG